MTDSSVLHIMPGLATTRTIIIPECLLVVNVIILVIVAFWLLNKFLNSMGNYMIDFLEIPIDIKGKPTKKAVLSHCNDKKASSPKADNVVLFIEKSKTLASFKECTSSEERSKEWYDAYAIAEKEVEEVRQYFMSHMNKLTLNEKHLSMFVSFLNDTRAQSIPIQELLLSIVEANINLYNEGRVAQIHLYKEQVEAYTTLKERHTALLVNLERRSKSAEAQELYKTFNSLDVKDTKKAPFLEHIGGI